MKRKAKKITALLLSAALTIAGMQMDGTAAENIISDEVIEQTEVPETEEWQEGVKTGDEMEALEDSWEAAQSEILVSETEATEEIIQEEAQTETLEAEMTEEVQEETQTETLETEITQETQTEITGTEITQEIQTETLEAEITQTETLETEITQETQTEIAGTEITEEVQTEFLENDSAIQQINEEESPADDVGADGEFTLQSGDKDITSGKFGAVLAHMTLPTKPDIKNMNPRIVGADGSADAYFKNLDIIAEDNGGENTAAYRLVGDVSAETPIGTYTVRMTVGKQSDTATFAVVEKGIEGLKMKNVPSVVSSEKKINIKPVLEINGDTAGNDKTKMPKNKKMAWEIVNIEGVSAPASLKINRKNGAVTVNAGDSGAFRIKAATADSRYTDAEGKPVSVTSGIVEIVSGSDQRLESLAGCTIVMVDNPDPAKAKLLNQNGKTADMGCLDGKKAYIKVQKADGSFVDASNYVLKSNNKAFRIGTDTSVSCILTKPIASGKTLTIRLTASLVNGRKEQPLKGEITVQSAASGEQDLSLALGVSGAGQSLLKDEGRTLEYNGSASTLIKMELMKNGNPVGSPASYNIKLKNLKKVSETVSKDSIAIYATLNKASGTATLTDCSTGKQTIYEVRNVEKTIVLGKSPAIKQGTNPASNAGPDYTVTAKGKVVTDYTHVRVEPLPADYMKSCRNRKTEGRYRAFVGAMGLDPYGSETAFRVYEIDPENNTFRIPFVKAEQPVKGSYKLQMTVGKLKGGRFEATAVPVIVATKVSGNRAEPERTPQEQRLSRIEGVSAVANKEEYDKILPPETWTGRPENFTDVSLAYEMVSSRNQVTVSGSLRRVEGFTGFGQEEINQNGYYMLARIKLPDPETGMTYNSMAGTIKAVSERALTYADLSVDGTDVYLNILVKVAEANAAKATDAALTLDYDGEGQTYKESTYTFDLSGVKLETGTEVVNKVLVAYFSATNTTEGVAKKLASGLGADLYEIVPEIPYTSADLNYNTDCRANREMNDPTARPAISGSVENMGQYEVVFVGYPIWWGQAPKIMYTFMESYDFSGKTIVPFCTSGSSGIGSSATNLEQVTSGAVWLSGRRFSGSVSQSTLMDWVDSLDLKLGENPVVYMTTDISSDGLMAVYGALGANPAGKVAVKLSTGENGSNYLRPELIGNLVQSLSATIVECNTAYGGQRANTAMHYQLAADHGYTAIAEVDIMDGDGSMTLPVTGGDNLTENYVGAHFANYDYYVILSHFKGHSMAGYGGAIKNISIGIASSAGKSHIHTGGKGGSMWSADQDSFLEAMAEAGKSVEDYLDGKILYINVMNRLSVDCDCDGSPAEPDMHDIGILASFDPVALDQACIDLVYSAEDGQSLVSRIESRNGLHTLEQAEKIGLGSRTYQLVSIDK